ncbi:hypothetical protein [Methylorubrum thiocyanatum]
MNRRSVLRWLGLAPVAAPAAVVAASAPVLPPIPYSGLDAAMRRRIEDAERNIAAIDTALGKRIDGAVARFGECEANPGLTHPFTFDGKTLRVPSVVIPYAAG